MHPRPASDSRALGLKTPKTVKPYTSGKYQCFRAWIGTARPQTAGAACTGVSDQAVGLEGWRVLLDSCVMHVWQLRFTCQAREYKVTDYRTAHVHTNLILGTPVICCLRPGWRDIRTKSLQNYVRLAAVLCWLRCGSMAGRHEGDIQRHCIMHRAIQPTQRRA